MKTEEIINDYFKNFLDYEIDNYSSYYSVIEYTEFKKGYYEIGMKNIEDLIYDENGDLLDDSKEYELLIDRFIDYLYTFKELDSYFKNNKYYTEEIFNNLIEKITIYCY